jgi:WD40 repeat protein
MGSTAIFSPDGRYFLVTVEAGGHEHVIRVDAGTWATTELPIDVNIYYPLCLNPNGTLLVYGHGGQVQVVDTMAFQVRHTLTGKPRAYSFSPNGALLASVDETNKLSVWDTNTWQEVRSFYIPAAYGGAGDLAFISGGNAIVTLGAGETTVWDETSGGMVKRLVYSGHVAHLMPDGQRLAYCGYDARVHVLDLALGREVNLFPANDVMASDFEFTPSGRFAVGITGATISLFSVSNGTLLTSLEGDPVEVEAIALSADGRYAASVGRTGRVCVWDISALNSYCCAGFRITKVDWGKGCVTINNSTTSPLDLVGWTLSDGEGSYTFPKSLVVAGGESRSFCADVYNPDGARRGLVISDEDEQVSLYVPEVCGGNRESTKRQ